LDQISGEWREQRAPWSLLVAYVANLLPLGLQLWRNASPVVLASLQFVLHIHSNECSQKLMESFESEPIKMAEKSSRHLEDAQQPSPPPDQSRYKYYTT
jgi:hypothetical protein